MLVRMTVWSSKKAFLSRKVFLPKKLFFKRPRYVLGLRDLYGRNRASLRGQFLSLLKVLTKILDFLYSAITLMSGVREQSLRYGLVSLGR